MIVTVWAVSVAVWAVAASSWVVASSMSDATTYV